MKKTSTPIEEKLKTPIEEKLKVNIYNNINNIKKNNSTKFEKRQYSQITQKAFLHFANLFPEKYRPKTQLQKNKWLDCLEKIQKIDKYDLREVYNVAKNLRQDEFWQNHFLTILKNQLTQKT